MPRDPALEHDATPPAQLHPLAAWFLRGCPGRRLSRVFVLARLAQGTGAWQGAVFSTICVDAQL